MRTEIFSVCFGLGSELKSDQRRLRILSGGRQLQISSTQKADAASYTCLASSAAGTTSKEYILQVYGTYIVSGLLSFLLGTHHSFILVFSPPLHQTR